MKSSVFAGTAWRCLLPMLLAAGGFNAEAQAQPAGFVRRQGTSFTLDGQPYRFIGVNYWYGGLLATQGEAGKARLKKELDFLKKQGATNLRVMVGAEGLSHGYQYRVLQPLQPEPGKFDEKIAVGLDYLLAELDKRQMKAVLHFTNTWEWSGGLTQYLEWNGYPNQPLPKDPDYNWNKFQQYVAQFYACEPCKEQVNTYIRYVLGRTNTVTKKPYLRDPAIMAWEIINEPRPMTAAATPAFEAWMKQTAALIKSLDKNHLLTTGSEGDIATDNDMAVYERLHTDPHIDYLTIHIWPKNWGWFRDTATAKGMPAVIAKATAYVDKHAAEAQKLGKPLVIEEFGLPRDGQTFTLTAPTTLRDEYYAALFGMMKKDPVIAGYNFWAFGGTARPVPDQTFWKAGDAYMGDPGGEEQGLNSVFDADKSTWAVISKYLKTMK